MIKNIVDFQMSTLRTTFQTEFLTSTPPEMIREPLVS